jgi:hypothetical protein
MMVGSEDMMLVQESLLQRMRRHNRYLVGWGVVCGCEVQPAPTAQKPWQVRICPGYLVTPQGDEVTIASEALFDLASCLVQSADPCAFARPCPPVSGHIIQSRKIYLAVCHTECNARPMRVAPVGCGCDEAECEFSRIRDGYELCCLDKLPDIYNDPQLSCSDLCQKQIFPCPACPDDPCVVIATIMLPAASTAQIGLADIDNLADRRLLYTTAMLQTMALCNCTQQPVPPPPTVKQLLAPQFAPPGGTFGRKDTNNGKLQVTINDPNIAPPNSVKAQIYFTQNGGLPAPVPQQLYKKAITLSWLPGISVTLRAVAHSTGWQDSDVNTAVFTFVE